MYWFRPFVKAEVEVNEALSMKDCVLDEDQHISFYLLLANINNHFLHIIKGGPSFFQDMKYHLWMKMESQPSHLSP